MSTLQLGPAAVNQLRDTVRRVLLDGSAVNPVRYDTGPQALYVAKVGASDIAALSGTTPGSATVTIQTFDGSNQLTASSATITAYNFWTSVVPAGAYITVVQEIATGRYVISGFPPIKPLCRFTLGGTLGTGTASQSATISAQYGPGLANSTSITVHNLLTSTGGVYVFDNASGDAGLAIWDSGTNYRIIQMEC